MSTDWRSVSLTKARVNWSNVTLLFPQIDQSYGSCLDDCDSEPDQYKDFFTCSDRRCLDKYRACDGTKDCISGEDETVDECNFLYDDTPTNYFPCTLTGHLINNDQVMKFIQF